MPFTRIEVSKAERSLLYFRRPEKTPWLVWLLRALLLAVITSTVVSLIGVMDVFGAW